MFHEGLSGRSGHVLQSSGGACIPGAEDFMSGLLVVLI